MHFILKLQKSLYPVLKLRVRRLAVSFLKCTLALCKDLLTYFSSARTWEGVNLGGVDPSADLGADTPSHLAHLHITIF